MLNCLPQQHSGTADVSKDQSMWSMILRSLDIGSVDGAVRILRPPNQMIRNPENEDLPGRVVVSTKRAEMQASILRIVEHAQEMIAPAQLDIALP